MKAFLIITAMILAWVAYNSPAESEPETETAIYDPWQEHLIYVMPGETINEGVMK